MAISAELTLGFELPVSQLARLWNDSFDREGAAFCPQYIDPWEVTLSAIGLLPQENAITDGSLTVSKRPTVTWDEIVADRRIRWQTPGGEGIRVALQGESIWGTRPTERAMRATIAGQSSKEWLTTVYATVDRLTGSTYCQFVYALSSQLWLSNPRIEHTQLSLAVRTTAWLRLGRAVRNLYGSHACVYTDMETEGIVDDWAGAELFCWLRRHPAFRGHE